METPSYSLLQMKDEKMRTKHSLAIIHPAAPVLSYTGTDIILIIQYSLCYMTQVPQLARTVWMATINSVP